MLQAWNFYPCSSHVMKLMSKDEQTHYQFTKTWHKSRTKLQRHFGGLCRRCSPALPPALRQRLLQSSFLAWNLSCTVLVMSQCYVTCMLSVRSGIALVVYNRLYGIRTIAIQATPLIFSYSCIDISEHAKTETLVQLCGLRLFDPVLFPNFSLYEIHAHI